MLFGQKSLSDAKESKSVPTQGGTHHILVIILLLSWNPSVRVAVPDSKLHGAAKSASNWQGKSRQVSVSGQCKHKASIRHSALCSVLSGMYTGSVF